MDLKTISDEKCRISKKEVLPKSRLKIRRFPSCKIHKVSTASCLPSYTTVKHVQQQIQPLIIHTYDPKIIVTEPSDFKWVVQKLTGSSNTRSSVCKLKREMKKERQLQAHADLLALASITEPFYTSPNEVNHPLTPKSSSNITSSDDNAASTELKEGNSDMDDSVSPKSSSNLTTSEDNTASTELKEGSLDTDGTSTRSPFPCFEQDMAAEEYNFFSFSFDSYYANNGPANDMDPFSADSFVYPMALSPGGDVLNLSSLKDLSSCLPTVDEVI